MDIEDLGEKVIEQLVQAKLVHTLADLYRLDQVSLMALERMAQKSSANVLSSIEKSKTTRDFGRVLFRNSFKKCFASGFFPNAV